MGPVHSNTAIGLRYSPIFYGPVSVSRERFIYFNPQNIFFAEPPRFGAPLIPFPSRFDAGRAEGLVIGSPESRQQSRLVLDGDAALLYRWRQGMPFSDTLDPELVWIAENPLLFFDEPLELKGELEGRLTIGASGNIGLIDNVRYRGSDNRFGWFDPDTMESLLGLVAEGNIVIRNTRTNGKDNGFRVEPNNYDRHSIAINGALLALGESFTFEHQNDEWEFYQGPMPDERGWIFLQGSLAQKRRGHIRRTNHIGTGYLKAYHDDHRLREQRPPFFPEIPAPLQIPNWGNVLNLKRDWGPYEIDTVEVMGYDTILVEAGTEITLRNGSRLVARRYLRMEGTPDLPILIRGTGEVFIEGNHLGTAASISRTHFDSHALLHIVDRGQNAPIRNLQLSDLMLARGRLELAGRIGTLSITRCQIAGDVVLPIVDDLRIIDSDLRGNWTMSRDLSTRATINITDCNIGGRWTMERYNGAGFTASGTRFRSGLVCSTPSNLISWFQLVRCIVEGGMTFSGREWHIEAHQCNFINTGGVGLAIEHAYQVTLVNSIFAHSRIGLQEDTLMAPRGGYRRAYCLYGRNDSLNYASSRVPYFEVYADPRFVDPDFGDFSLRDYSPAIDAGDPAYPNDPDGSRADIGAIPYDHRLAAPPPPRATLPSSLTLSVHPNPFNDRTTLDIALPAGGVGRLTIYDIAGRVVLRERLALSTGVNRIALDRKQLAGPGLYLVEVEAGSERGGSKMVLLK